MTERLWAMKREVDGFVRWYGPGCHGWGFSWASPVAVEEHHLPSASAGGTVVEFVPATELEQAQEEARVLRRALEMACEDEFPTCGTCPYDRDNVEDGMPCEGDSGGCVDQHSECWATYRIAQARATPPATPDGEEGD